MPELDETLAVRRLHKKFSKIANDETAEGKGAA
jgi:hypothetical protein